LPHSHGGGTCNDLAKLRGNSGLSRLVVLKRQLIVHLIGILRSVLHCLHTRRLLGGGVLKVSDENIGGQVQLVESDVARVFVRKNLIVELAVRESLEELVLRHQFEVPLLISDSRDELVVENDNLVDVSTRVGDINRHRHDSRVVHRRRAVSNGRLENIGEGPGEASGALVSDGKDLEVGTVASENHLLDLTDDGRVDGTAETLVRRNRNEERARISDVSRHLALQELIGLEHHIKGSAAEVPTALESG